MYPSDREGPLTIGRGGLQRFFAQKRRRAGQKPNKNTYFTGLSYFKAVVFVNVMRMNQEARDKLAAALRRAAERQGAGYDNLALNSFARELDSLMEDLRQHPHPHKTERHGRKGLVLGMLKDWEQLRPTNMVGDVSTITPHMGALATQRRELEFNGGDNHVLRTQGDTTVDALAKTIAAAREAIQPKRPRTFHLGDVNTEKYRAFARAFAEAAKTDRTRGDLRGLPAISKLAEQANCYVRMLDYVEQVKQVADVMRSQPPSLWNDNRDEIAAGLAKASQAFLEGTRGQVTTAEAVQRFRQEDARVKRAHSPDQIVKASEQLRDLALTFILGGPADMKGGNDKPKLLSRISDAYRQDYRRIHTAKKQWQRDARLGSFGEEPAEPVNPLTQPLKTLDYVYAARWALAADKLEAMVRSQDATLADPAIGTFAQPETTVTEIRPVRRERTQRAEAGTEPSVKVGEHVERLVRREFIDAEPTLKH